MKTFKLAEAYRELGTVLRAAQRGGGVLITLRDRTLRLRVSVVNAPRPARTPIAPWKPGPELSRKRLPRGVKLLLSALQHELSRLPPAIRDAIVLYAKHPENISVDTFAHRAGMRRRSADRRIDAAGFSGTAPLIKGVALAALWESLREDPPTGFAKAARLGHSERILRTHIREIFQRSSADAFATVNLRDMARAVAGELKA